MGKKELDEIKNKKKKEIIEIIRKLPDEHPIHKVLYEFIKEATRT